MHQRNRYRENGPIPFRSSRFYSVNSEWYFAIRRGSDQGPYTTKSEAKKALIKFLNEQLAFERNLKRDRQLINSFNSKMA